MFHIASYRQMQIKIILTHHLTLVRMTIIKESVNNKSWGKCEEKGALLYCGGVIDCFNSYVKHYGEALKTRN